jgi:hypothetical protein
MRFKVNGRGLVSSSNMAPNESSQDAPAGTRHSAVIVSAFSERNLKFRVLGRGSSRSTLGYTTVVRCEGPLRLDDGPRPGAAARVRRGPLSAKRAAALLSVSSLSCFFALIESLPIRLRTAYSCSH